MQTRRLVLKCTKTCTNAHRKTQLLQSVPMCTRRLVFKVYHTCTNVHKKTGLQSVPYMYQCAQEDWSSKCTKTCTNVQKMTQLLQSVPMCTRRLLSKVYHTCTNVHKKTRLQSVPYMYQCAQEDWSSKCTKTCTNVHKKTQLLQSVPMCTRRLVFKVYHTCTNVHKKTPLQSVPYMYQCAQEDHSSKCTIHVPMCTRRLVFKVYQNMYQCAQEDSAPSECTNVHKKTCLQSVPYMHQCAQENSSPKCTIHVPMCTRRPLFKVYHTCTNVHKKTCLQSVPKHVPMCTRLVFRMYHICTNVHKKSCLQSVPYMYQCAQEDSSPKCIKAYTNVHKKTCLQSVPKHDQFAQEDSTPSMCTRRLFSKVYQIMYQCTHSSFKVYQNLPTCTWRLKCYKMNLHAQEDLQNIKYCPKEDLSYKCTKTCTNVHSFSKCTKP